jgi:hypothetical protein
MLKPRNTLTETRASGQLRRDFFAKYILAYLQGGEDNVIGDAIDVFEVTYLSTLRTQLRIDALETKVVLTDRLSNRVLGTFLKMGEHERAIAINARFKMDPEMLLHTLLEEYAHAQQAIDNLDFAEQRRLFPNYSERPYEIAAKRLAEELSGYALDDYDTYLRREAPNGILYDRVNTMDPTD